MSDPILVTVGDGQPPITVSVGAPQAPPEVTVSLAGDRGPPGDPGPSTTISIGTVTTGAPGSAAAASISGSSPNQTLSLVIPSGEAGQQGPPGVDGADGSDGAAATISIGTVTTGAPGSAASVINSGTLTAATLDFAIPAGEAGQQGPQGPPGVGVAVAGTVATAAELPAASSVSANTGYVATDTGDLHVSNGVDQWVNVGPFRGEQGPAGPAGPQGEPGPPEAHTHPISDVVSLQAALDAKAAATHSHEIADVNGLQQALNEAGGGGGNVGTTPPADCLSTGLVGELQLSATHLYVCVAADQWKRIPLESFGTCATSITITAQPQDATATTAGSTWSFVNAWAGGTASHLSQISGAVVELDGVGLASDGRVGDGLYYTADDGATWQYLDFAPSQSTPYLHSVSATWGGRAYFYRARWRRAACELDNEFLVQQGNSSFTQPCEYSVDAFSCAIDGEDVSVQTLATPSLYVGDFSSDLVTGCTGLATSGTVSVMTLWATAAPNYGLSILDAPRVPVSLPLRYAATNQASPTWSNASVAAGRRYAFDDIAYAAGRFVAVGVGQLADAATNLAPCIATSEFGFAWDVISLVGFRPLSVAHGRGRWVAVGISASGFGATVYDAGPYAVPGNETRTVLTSDDGGDTWVTRDSALPILGHWWKVVFEPQAQQFVAVADGQIMAVSPDGLSWQAVFAENELHHREASAALGRVWIGIGGYGGQVLPTSLVGSSGGSASSGSFSVSATSTSGAISYVWQRSTDGGASWTNIVDATTSSYSTPPVDAAMNQDRYRVRLTSGGVTVTSDEAVLTVVS